MLRERERERGKERGEREGEGGEEGGRRKREREECKKTMLMIFISRLLYYICTYRRSSLG